MAAAWREYVTVTENPQVARLPVTRRAVTCTVVVPTGKLLPDAGCRSPSPARPLPTVVDTVGHDHGRSVRRGDGHVRRAGDGQRSSGGGGGASAQATSSPAH